jgi:protein SCO1/2
VLKEYAQRFGADESRWKFLTGEPETVKSATRAVMLAATRDADGQIVHSEKFLLVDGDAKLRGIYESNNEPDMERLKQDATALADDAAANR